MRTLYSISIVILVLAIGTEAMHALEGWSYVDSFYFISLLATTQGPTNMPKTDLGKIFASVIAFVSVGAVLSAIVFVFGPLFGTVLKVGIDHVEKEEAKLRHKDTEPQR
jgi:voltage-gated potassium channel